MGRARAAQGDSLDSRHAHARGASRGHTREEPSGLCCTSWSARPRPARANAARARPWNFGPTCLRIAACCCRCCATMPRCRCPRLTSWRRTGAWFTRVQAIVSLESARSPRRKEAHTPPPTARDESETWLRPVSGATTGENPRGKTVDSDLPEGVRALRKRARRSGLRRERARRDWHRRAAHRGRPAPARRRRSGRLLRANQLLRPGKPPCPPVCRRGPRSFAHEVGGVDRADAIRSTRKLPSLTLAGDTAQKLFWTTDFGRLGGGPGRTWAWTTWPSSPCASPTGRRESWNWPALP